MKTLNKKAFEGLTFFIIALAALLFLPVWTFDYWQVWVFLAVFSVSVFLITLYLMKNDAKLLERRINAGSSAEKEKKQKNIQFIAQFAFILAIVFAPIDHRFGWSSVLPIISLLGDLCVILGLLFVFYVFKENTFTSAIIEVDNQQKVISTGPYSIIRHPMYAGALIMLFGIPIALGSWWGVLAVIPITIIIIIRLLEEEKFLTKNLKGYEEYKNKVKYRLVPFMW